MFKKYLTLILIFIPVFTFGQNTLTVADMSSASGDTVTISVNIDNADPFVVCQLSLFLNDELTYLEGSASLTGRAVDHSLSANLVTGDSLRLLAYSANNTAFTGNSGSVLTFKLILGTIPGNYNLIPKNVIIGNDVSANILTGSTTGTVTIETPDIDLSTGSLNYTRTVVGNTRNLSFTIYNTGNTTLSIDSIVVEPAIHYSITPGWNSTINSSSQTSVTVQFAPIVKGTLDATVRVYSDDPDEIIKSVQLSGLGYKINELHVNNLTTRSGFDTTLTVRINNQEDITGFQFDLDIPSSMTFLNESEELTSRSNGHQISANVLANGDVRILAHSIDQNAFVGMDGDVARIGFHVDGLGGTYSINPVNVILTNDSEENVVSDSYNGQLNIASSDIQSISTINFGTVSVFDTSNIALTISNNGNDTLFINNFTSNNTNFWAELSLPMVINPSQQSNVSTFFHSDSDGDFTGKFKIRSNDPDEYPFYITTSGSAFIPNILIVEDTTGVKGQNININLSITNNENFNAFQFDLIVPVCLTVNLSSCQLTSRAQGHSLSKTQIESNKYRFLAYSTNNDIFTGDSGPVLQVNCDVSGSPGAYTLSTENQIIGGTDGQNVFSSAVNGTFTLDTIPSKVENIVPQIIGNDLKLTWQTTSGAATYNIYKGTTTGFVPDKAGGSNRVATNHSSLNWTDTGVIGNPAINYFYIITGVSSGGSEGENSDVIGEFDFQLYSPSTGYNTITFVLDDPNITTAAELGAAIPNCTAVKAWDASTQGYPSLAFKIGEQWFGSAEIQVGKSYYVNVTSQCVLSCIGTVNAFPEYSLLCPSTGYNTIAIPFTNNLTTATQLGENIPNCTAVKEWDPSNQSYTSLAFKIEESWLGSASIKCGYTYYINVTENGSWDGN
ncbi:choice-of-anchor D domain-containing protein [candidate division KSB1 bacterium]|nr:choice-of-anchor D domain-containing protein [candidate division KSB1 bacterium]